MKKTLIYYLAKFLYMYQAQQAVNQEDLGPYARGVIKVTRRRP